MSELMKKFEEFKAANDPRLESSLKRAASLLDLPEDGVVALTNDDELHAVVSTDAAGDQRSMSCSMWVMSRS